MSQISRWAAKDKREASTVSIFIPPATAVSQSPAHKEVHASCIAARLEEQAVSMLKLGPLNLKW